MPGPAHTQGEGILQACTGGWEGRTLGGHLRFLLSTITVSLEPYGNPIR